MPIELKGRIHSSKQQSARLPNKVVIQRRLIFGRPDSGGANIDKVNTKTHLHNIRSKIKYKPMATMADNPCVGNRRSQDDDTVFFYPGPIQLIYGSESPIHLADIVRHISSAKKRRRNIDHLSFLECQFYDDTRTVFATLGKKLRRVKDIKELSICGIHNVGNDEIISFAPLFNSSNSLRSLDLTGGRFDVTAINAIQRFFRRNNSSLEVLNLSDNSCLGDESVENIMSSLQSGGQQGKKKNNNLQVLALEGCGLGHSAVSSISTFMTQGGGSYLRVLELSNNMIGNKGAEILASSIGCHPLAELNLNNANIGDLGCMALGQVLKNNTSLHTLSLQNNMNISDIGASYLLDAVYNTTSIKTIIESNHTLKNLNLRGCTRMSPRLLQFTIQLCAHGRLVVTKNDIIRNKISTYLKNKNTDCGMALEDHDLELMPHILSFIARFNGISSLFHTLKSMPLLYTQHSFQPAKSLNSEDDKENEEPVNETNSFKLPAPSKMKKYFTIHDTRVPRHCLMCRYQDHRAGNTHETSQVSSTNNNKYRSKLDVIKNSMNFCLNIMHFRYVTHSQSIFCTNTSFIPIMTTQDPPR